MKDWHSRFTAVALMLGILCAVVMVVLAVTDADAKSRHAKGCNTHACDKRVAKKWDRKHPMQQALASWYDYEGVACAGMGGLRNGIAHKTLPCGTRVRLCYRACTTGIVNDRGPYIAGREFDLTPDVKNATGCSDLCWLRYRIQK
jgi:rare lipoprotein A (peptidoglycan hydrolase)